ncbi:MAG: phenylalanine--tRNA ligase beta subunit-related protein [Candidatus Anstonellales archaeon]
MANVRVKHLSKEDMELLNDLGFPSEDSIVEITPNRPDMLSEVGIRRVIDLYRGKKISDYRSKRLGIDINIEHVPSRPYIEIATLELSSKIELDDLIEFQEKLHETYGRKRKRVAIGIHDLDYITPPITYRAVYDETFIPLNSNQRMNIEQILKSLDKGKEYGHLVSSPYPMLYDSTGVISFPPIINSDRTKLREETRKILIDVTGINQHYVKDTMKILLCYFIDLGAKNVESTTQLDYKTITAPASRIRELINIDVDYREMLMKSGIEYDGNVAIIPPYRVDFMDWTDVAEEIAINYGYNHIPRDFPKIYQSAEISEDPIRDIMDRMGFSEVYTSFLVKYDDAKEYFELEKLQNSVSEDYNAIRPSLELSLLRVIHKNRNAKLPYKIYEIGRVYDPKLDREYDQIGFAIMQNEFRVEDYLSVIKTLAIAMNAQLHLDRGSGSKILLDTTSFKGKIDDYEFYVGAVKYEILERFEIDRPVVMGIIFKK